MTTPQQPIDSGFGPATTSDDVLQGHDLTGKQAIVTGGYDGIGLETTRNLAKAGAQVTVPARSLKKAHAALDGLANATIEPLDLLNPASIDAFVAKFVESGKPLHILINNAGIMANPLTRDARGYESQFATNHLGHFHLAARLWPALKRANGARVVAVSSRGHRRAGVDFDDPNFEQRKYERWVAYGQSKSANVLFAVGFDAKAMQHGVRAFALHPGAIITNLAQYISKEDIRASGVLDENDQYIYDPVKALKTPEQGAATSLWCATSPTLDGMGGVYCEDCNIAHAVPADSTGLTGVRPWAIDRALAQRLWALSEKLTGVRATLD
jgi:NAD(P)-dependent dehydrogenase (short-subunit alcohol dehydrogenase family)